MHFIFIILCSPFHFLFSASLSSFDLGLFSLPLLLLWYVCCVCVCGQMTAGRCHTLLSPVTEESGEEGTNSEVSSPPACRSPSPGANADAPLNQVLQRPLTIGAPAIFYSPNIYFAHESSLTALSWPGPPSLFSSHQPNIQPSYFKDVCSSGTRD